MYSVCNDHKGRVAPFGNLRINARLLAPRSLSQATTSFVAGYRLGIHHVHLVTCPYNVNLWRLIAEFLPQSGSSPKHGYSSLLHLTLSILLRCRSSSVFVLLCHHS